MRSPTSPVRALVGVLVILSSLLLAGAPGRAATTSGTNGLVVAETPNSLVAINPITGERVVLAGSSGADLDPEVSSDGTKVAFENAGRIFVANFPTGTNRLQVTTTGGPYSSPAWSPDGKTLVFSSASGLHVAAPASNAVPVDVQESRPSDVDPDFSPDGQFIVFASTATPGGVTRVNANQSGARTVLQGTVSGDQHPRVMPDSSKVVFFNPGANQGILTLRWSLGGERTLLSGTVTGDVDPFPSPDGTKVGFEATFAGSTPGTNPAGIGTVNANSTGGRAPMVGSNVGDQRGSWQRSGGPSQPSTSINGLIVVESAASSTTFGDGPLVAFDTNTGQRTALSASTGADNNAEVSPNGRRIAFDNAGNIFVADFPSGNSRVSVTTAGTASAPFAEPTWSPDGKKLVFTSPTGLRSSDPVTNAVVSALNGTQQGDFQPGYSPDGRFVVFTDTSGGGNNFAGVTRVNADGTGSRTKLLETATGDNTPRVAPNGLRVFATKLLPNGGIVSMTWPNGGGRQDLGASTTGDGIPAPSPDSTKVAFQTTQGIVILNADSTGARQFAIGTARGDVNAFWAHTPADTGAQCPGHLGDARTQVVGSEGNDLLKATTSGTIVCGLGGNDVLIASPQGNTQMEGGEGSDVLCARQNFLGDVLDGGTGIDRGRFDNGETATVERFAPIRFCAS